MPKMTTWRPAPIWGAASPAPSSARMVSRMSSIRAYNSGVSKRSTGAAGSSRRGSPIFSTGLTAMVELHQILERGVDALHRLLQNGVDFFIADAVPAGTAASGIIGHYADGCVAQADLLGQRRLRHAGHAHHGGTVALEPVDLRRRFQARALHRGVHAAVDHLLPGLTRRRKATLPHFLAIRFGEIHVGDGLVAAFEEAVR